MAKMVKVSGCRPHLKPRGLCWPASGNLHHRGHSGAAEKHPDSRCRPSLVKSTRPGGRPKFAQLLGRSAL